LMFRCSASSGCSRTTPWSREPKHRVVRDTLSLCTNTLASSNSTASRTLPPRRSGGSPGGWSSSEFGIAATCSSAGSIFYCTHAHRPLYPRIVSLNHQRSHRPQAQ
jgi:hypothetical protein